MISLYSGTPGSGKSFHMADRIYCTLKYTKKPVITNTAIDLEALQLTTLGYIKRNLNKYLHIPFRKYNQKPIKGDYVYMDDAAMTPDALRTYAKEHLRPGVPNQALILIDEAAMKFNSRMWNVADRQDWVTFFQTHRHYGYDVILVCQHERMLDRQIRAFLEYEFIHRNARNVGFMGFLVSLFCGGNLFVVVQKWCGCRDRLGTSFCRFNRRIACVYDSYAIFEPSVGTPERSGGGAPRKARKRQVSVEMAEPESCPDVLTESTPEPEPAPEPPKEEGECTPCAS